MALDCSNTIEVRTKVCKNATDLEEMIIGSENDTTTNYGAKTIAKLVSERMKSLGNIAVNYIWQDSSERSSQTGMTSNEIGFQLDTQEVYRYSTQWDLLNNIPIPNNYGFKNYLLNPFFDIWQDGDSFSFINSGIQYTADQWVMRTTGSNGSVDIDKVSVASGTERKTYALRWSQNVSSSSGNPILEQRIENVRTLNGEIATLSINHTLISGSSLISVSVEQYFGSGGSDSVSTDIGVISVSGINSTDTIGISIPSVSGKTIGDGSYVSIQLKFQENETFVYEIYKAQLEKGNLFTFFEDRPIGLELESCQRFYEKGITRFRGGLATGVMQQMVFYRVTKRVFPTVTEDGASITLSSSDNNGFCLTSTVSSTGVINWTSSARL